MAASKCSVPRPPPRRATLALALSGAIAAAVTLGGCDGTAGHNVEAPDADVPDAEPLSATAALGVAIARAVCEKVDECCAAGERSRIIGVGENRAACEASFGSFYGRQYGALMRFVTEGRAALSTEKLEPCLAAYRDAGCNAPGAAVGAQCAQVLEGTTQIGEPCEAGAECASHSCPGARQNERVCAARKPEGAACSRGTDCASFYCRTALLGGTCGRPGQERTCGGDGFWLVI